MNETYQRKRGSHFAFFRGFRLWDTPRSGVEDKMRFQKYGADKIVLLGLFIVALLAARLITVSRSAIVLSEPIELNYSGLSLSMPAGNGWQSEKQWRYQGNAFILSSFFNSGSGSVTALARCQYLLAATRATPDILLKEKTSAIGGVIAKTGQTRTGGPHSRFAKEFQNGLPLTIDWAHIKKPETLFDVFFGTIRLPNNRQLNIEVYQTAGDTDLTRRVFERIAESLRFKDNQLLEAGSEIIAEIKSKGIESFLAPTVLLRKSKQWGQSREDFFLIKDAKGNSVGFTMEILIDSAPEAQLNIKGVSLLYIRGPFTREHAVFFQSRDNLDEFAWKSETSSSTGKSSVEVVLGKAGVMTVKEYGPRAKEKNYQLGAAAIPKVLLDLAFSQLLERDDERIIVDIIEADGEIIPTLVSRIDVEDPVAAESDPILQKDGEMGTQEEVSYALKIEPLDGRGFSEHLYLNAQRRISKRLLRSPNAIKGVGGPLRQKGIYTLGRSSVEDVLRQFPERADYILVVSSELSRRDPILQRDSKMGTRKE